MFRRVIILAILVLITHRGTAIADAESNTKATVAAVVFNGIGLYGNARQVIRGERNTPVAVYGILVGTIFVSLVAGNADSHNWRSEAVIVTVVSATAIALSIANLMQNSPKNEGSGVNTTEGEMKIQPTLNIEEGGLMGGGVQIVVPF
jgi:hypothetical protein